MPTVRLWFSLVLLCSLLASAQASRVSLSPVMLQLQPNVQSSQLTLHNDDAQPVTFDLKLLAWTQVDGQDLLGSTQAVVVAPATVTLAPGASQTVRLARLGAPTLQELAYRLIITERPSEATGVSTRLQFSVPLFDGTPVANAPVSSAASATPALQANLTADQTVLLTNPGAVHVRLTTLEAQVGGVWTPVPLLYVLAGQSRRLDVKGVQALRYTSDGIVTDVAIR